MSYSNLKTGDAVFASMMKHFGVVTVMDATIYDTSVLLKDTKFFNRSASEILTKLKTIGDSKDSTQGYICTLTSLKTANVNIEGPEKEITGGRYNNTLIKFGKSATMEIQDALGNSEAIEALLGGVQEWSDKVNGTITALHYGEDFSGPKTIVGDSFFIDSETGQQVKVKIIFYQFVPDSLFNLTQDAEGDATVFDMNGSLKTTDITIGTNNGGTVSHGVFYSILSGDETTTSKTDSSTNSTDSTDSK